MGKSLRDQQADRTSWLTTGVVAGIVAGVVFATFEMIMAEIQGDGFFMPLRMIGAIVLGDDALSSSYSLAGAAAAGIVVYMMMSAVFGGIFGALVATIPTLRGSRSALIVGATVFGFALWIVNFYVIAPAFFSWFEMADPVVQFIAHTFFFGSLLGLLLVAREPAPPRR